MGPPAPLGSWAVPKELLDFQLTLSVATPGVTPAELLGSYDAYVNQSPPRIGSVQRQVPLREVAGWRVTADVYRPPGEPPFPVLAYLHGGAWVMGSPWTHRRLAADLASLGMLTFVIDYRRAPKHRFPAAVDDTVHAAEWVRRNAERFGGNGEALFVGGDSAGANLAAAALVAGDVGPVAGALLCYGIYDFHRALPRLAALIGGAHAAEQQYVEPAALADLVDDPRLNPERSCAALPRTLVLAGGRDPLYSESASLAERLASTSVPFDFVSIEDAPHGVLQLPGHPGHSAALAAIERFIGPIHGAAVSS
ncbi:MAG TPA: alpha/beta hydrolase fold domain-containing protein [Jatrophihabitans sp.]|nr:alpha/beta hydrolase fold domain-containing protein [Jatrophihabitans sp.]